MNVSSGLDSGMTCSSVSNKGTVESKWKLHTSTSHCPCRCRSESALWLSVILSLWGRYVV